MKKSTPFFVLVGFSLFLLSGCFPSIQIVSVDQPTSGVAGEPFQSVVEAQIPDFIFNFNCAECWAAVSVRLPEGWQVVDCGCTYNGGGCDCDTPDPDFSALLAAQYPGNWVSRRLDKTSLAIGDVFNVTWTILPNSAGKFELDYFTAGCNDPGCQSDINQEIAFGHEIWIKAYVPALSQPWMLVLACLLALSAVIWMTLKKKKRPDRRLTVLLFAMLGIGAAVFVFPHSASAQPGAALCESKFSFDEAGLDAFKAAIEANPDLEKALLEGNLESKKFVITACISFDNLSDAQKRALQALLEDMTEDDFDAIAAVFLQADSAGSMKCMVLRGDPPRVWCIIKK